MANGSYIYRKEVDWSLLHQGLTIPVHLQVAFKSLLKDYKRGIGRTVSLLVDGQLFEAVLINQDFDRKKFRQHSDLVQIRFTEKSGLPKRLRAIFRASFVYIRKKREQTKARKTFVRVPEESREYLVFYTTSTSDLFLMEPITKAELSEANVQLVSLTEEEFELYGEFARTDDSAGIVLRSHLAKVRKLDRSIGEDLKRLYDFRCQICGENFSKPHNQRIVQVHHIIHFVRSMNNDYDNLMVACPNHHSVIHKANPIFDRQALRLSYPNGYHETLVLDRHLKA
ncbi:MAG TPA: HNH endonuclease signature motif containing protein [Nitrospirota bacterium]|nr:HNH endonuclease signature motif containing protein [Nitrospirota bacterium]